MRLLTLRAPFRPVTQLELEDAFTEPQGGLSVACICLTLMSNRRNFVP